MMDDSELVQRDVLPVSVNESGGLRRAKEVESSRRPVSRNDSRVSQLGDHIKVRK